MCVHMRVNVCLFVVCLTCGSAATDQHDQDRRHFSGAHTSAAVPVKGHDDEDDGGDTFGTRAAAAVNNNSYMHTRL